MANFSQFLDQTSNRRYQREQEGFAKALHVASGELPVCASCFNSFGMSIADFRGPAIAAEGQAPGAAPGWTIAFRDRRSIEWETSPAESNQETVFTWIGGSQVRPVRPAFPYATARLWVDGVERLRLPLGWPNLYHIVAGGFALDFEPRRFVTLVESSHRSWEPHGVSGFYRLHVPAPALSPGKPLRLRLEIDPPPEGTESLCYVSPRTDAVGLSLAVLRDEMAQLQADMVQLKRSHEMLYVQHYPELFPRRIKGERVIALQSETTHYHPATITVLRDGEAVITARAATDHIHADGRMIVVRSGDGGRTWGPRELLYQLGPRSDHRCGPIFELPTGEWLTTDYRAGCLYSADGVFSTDVPDEASLWGAWSRDRGQTWEFSKEPISVPGMHPFSEAERHMIQLPSGRLLVAANYFPWKADGKTPDWSFSGMALHWSDDNARTWHFLSKVPEDRRVMGEPTILRTRGGRVILLARSEVPQGIDMTCFGMVMQSVSLDEGKTWSPPEPTGMSSMSSPAHLLQLQDGRILVSHSARAYPGSIYITLSHDEGRTWDTAHTRLVTDDLANYDSTYPTSGQLPDGTILTTWYSNLFGKFFIAVLRHRPEEL